jgi:hypothetical protein
VQILTARPPKSDRGLDNKNKGEGAHVWKRKTNHHHRPSRLVSKVDALGCLAATHGKQHRPLARGNAKRFNGLVEQRTTTRRLYRDFIRSHHELQKHQ